MSDQTGSFALKPTPPGQTLVGKVAIVTGAGSVSDQVTGMGPAIALALLQAGGSVAGFDVQSGGLARFSELAARACPEGRFLPVVCDVTDPESCVAAVALVSRTLGAPDIVFNHAGVGEVNLGQSGRRRFWETDIGLWQRVQSINVTGPFLLTRQVLPAMLQRRWGRIVNTSTSFETMIDAFQSGYGPSKAALEASSAIWAKELEGSGVTVNCLLPGGMVATNQTLPLGVDLSALLPAAIMGPPARWLASTESDGVTGRRFVAREWDVTVAPAEAAARQQYPVAWPGLGPGRTADPFLGH